MPGSLDLETRAVTSAALLGPDYRRVSFELLCKEGDEVKAGAALMRDARRPEINLVAPAAGRVARVERGARRKLLSLQIDVDDTLGAVRHDPPADDERSTLRGFMLESGAWSSLRTRPFGNIPHPEAEPAAIFVTALDAEPFAPEPRRIIDAWFDEFRSAVSALEKISAAPVYLCHAPGHTLALGESDRVRRVAFEGGESAGLPGIHINALCPIGFAGGEVWHLGYQDVIALGHLLLRGTTWQQRVVSISGSAVKNPRCVLVTPGAAIDELLADELIDGPTQMLAGSPAYGRRLAPGQNFLAAGQRQLTVRATSVAEAETAQATGGVVIPDDRLERAAPPGIYPVPLLRALQLGDAERARELGALELVEEDVAALSRACVSNSDYGLLLREVLNQLEAGQ
jgi:Na+-transporting NADH:ubiquinone oxidoreductase subunit A